MYQPADLRRSFFPPRESQVKPASVLSFVLASSLAACSTGIEVKRVTGGVPVTGNPWNLAMTQFNITVTRHVVSCKKGIEANVEVIATPSAALDEDRRYVLSSNGWWATSDIISKLSATGVSTGLNAASTDATPTIISNVVGTIGQIAIKSAVGGGPLLTAGKPTCSESVMKMVNALYPEKGDGIKATVDKHIADLAALTAKVTLLTAKSALNAAFKDELAKTLDKQTELQLALAAKQKELSAALAATTNTQSIRWPSRGSEFVTQKPYTIDDGVMKKWLPEGAVADDVKSQLAVHLALYRQNVADGTWEIPAAQATGDTAQGVPVRLARLGRLVACVEAPCLTKLPATGSQDTRHTQFEQVVLQLGQIYTVPMTGGSFRSQEASIAMDANGLPTEIKVSEKVAGAVAATGAAKEVATQIAALPAQMSAARLAGINAQTSQLNAQAALEAAQANAGVAGQTAPLNAQIALINAQNGLAAARINTSTQQTAEVTAQTAMLNAQAALITAQSNATTGPAVGALNAQTSLINAETAQLNATAALVKARLATP
jgi:hypothetical protein